MPAFSGTFRNTNLTEVLRMIVDQRQTGRLRILDGDLQGFLTVENGTILHASTGTHAGLHALFQFVGWRDAFFEFQEVPIAGDLPRDLAVYESQVLITGVAFKVDELTLLSEAVPAMDDVLRFVGNGALASVEVTPSDSGLLELVDGHRTVREIAEEMKSSPADVARNLARFRLAGAVKLVGPKKTAAKPGKTILATAA